LNDMSAKNDVDGNTYDYNYYSDYTGVDEDHDDIGDIPYNITGDAPTPMYIQGQRGWNCMKHRLLPHRRVHQHCQKHRTLVS
jgi:hypothetical protein